MNIKVTDELVKFADEFMLNLKGKRYLPVAARVQIFRQLNPNGRIVVTPRVADGYVEATIYDSHGIPMATDIKSIQAGGKGVAAAYPLEMAATGAIGRALNLAGIGTMYGDLDEGDQIAESPVPQKKAKPKATTDDVAGIVKGF